MGAATLTDTREALGESPVVSSPDDRATDFDALLYEPLEESEKAFEEGYLHFCAFLDQAIIPNIAAQCNGQLICGLPVAGGHLCHREDES